MNRNITMLFTFVAGVAIGVVASYKVAEQKYRKLADEEIESVVDRFSNRQPMNLEEKVVKEPTKKVTEERVVSNKNNIRDYKDTVDRFGYDKISSDNSKPKKGDKKEGEEDMKQEVIDDRIYVISPDEFNTLDGFDVVTMYYSSDNYLLDSDCEVISDAEMKRTIGSDPFGHFGEYEDDSVYVRNEELMCDYEILLSMKTCAEIQEA